MIGAKRASDKGAYKEGLMHRFSCRRGSSQLCQTLIGFALAASLFAPAAHAGAKKPIQVLHDFQRLEGESPGALTLGSDGRFYGAAVYGGAPYFGTVFAMDKSGTLEVLHEFEATIDGQYPYTKLLAASDGYLYGTARYGAAYQCGSLFRVSPLTGVFELLWSFAPLGRNLEGCNPRGSMVEGQDGWIYGTTESGGNSKDGGTVYKWNIHSGEFKTIKTFAGWGTGDAYNPSSVALAPNGQLYGVTPKGGEDDLGAIYALNLDGSNYRIVFSYTWETDDLGSGPYGQLQWSKDGNFYGTSGGGAECCTAIFRLGLDGTVSLVYRFTFFGELGWPVYGDLTFGPDGLLYGTTNGSGKDGGGTVFTMSTAGEGHVVQSFTYSGNPNAPYTGLTKAGSYMYGSARRGFSEGTVIYRFLKK